jgi:predicted dehydrogenase
MLRVGLIGAGVMGSVHAEAWSQTPMQIAGILSRTQERAQKISEQYGCKVYDDLDQLLADVDVVDICTPTDTHHDLVLKAVQAGKHIVCEKPLAMTIQEGVNMLEACERAGVHLLMAHVVRFFPQYTQARSIVESGDIGKVAVVRLTRCSFQPGRETNSWLLDEARSGGVMLDLMIHDFDYARWVAGDVKSVYAKSVRSNDPQSEGDYALVMLQHVDGAISNIEGGWAYPPPMFRTSLEIAGDDGLIEHPADESNPLQMYLNQSGRGDSPDAAVPSSPLIDDPYTLQARHFYDVLVGNTNSIVSAKDGLRALQISLAAIQSAKTGKVVQLEEVG